jgi:hypothetical protein
MTTQMIDAPVLSGSALRSINFFNGRLLTGDDLRSEQAVQLARSQQFGRALGDGVAHGLEVSATAGAQPQTPVVTVARGQAVNRSGLVLELTSSVDVSLARGAPGTGAEPGALFADCQPYAPGTYTAGAGVYLLTIAPAQQGDGLAPVNGLGNTPSPCNVAASIQTVKFRLIRLALTPAELGHGTRLRNHVAYLCFAPRVLSRFIADPFGGPPSTYGLVDALRGQVLTDDEVPLAVIGWTIDTGIEFVDLWSVRRRITRPPAEDDFAAYAGDRRRAEGEAMFLQFQGHVTDLARGASGTPRGLDVFEFLPPVGLVPLRYSGSTTGLDLVALLDGLKRSRQVTLEGARLNDLVRAACRYPPVDLAGGDPIRVYMVRENQLSPAGTAPPQPYAVIVSGHVPYYGDARYDLALWDYANYAER